MDFGNGERLKTEEDVDELEIKAQLTKSELPDENRNFAKEPVEIQRKKVKYLEKIKEEVWKNNILE